MVQHLPDLDIARRDAFLTRMINILNENSVYPNNVLFSDESIFQLDKSVSGHISLIWSEVSPTIRRKEA